MNIVPFVREVIYDLNNREKFFISEYLYFPSCSKRNKSIVFWQSFCDIFRG